MIDINEKSSLFDRMKSYESAHTNTINSKALIIRVDGKAFHSLKPYLRKGIDSNMVEIMTNTMLNVVNELQSCVFAYTQSDEISFLLRSDRSPSEEPYLKNKVQKIVSIAASMATAWFNHEASDIIKKLCYFDARVFTMPDEDLPNYFIWRQKDWIRNSIIMLGRAKFSAQELHRKNSAQVLDMLVRVGYDFDSLTEYHLLGTAYHKDLGLYTTNFKYNNFIGNHFQPHE